LQASGGQKALEFGVESKTQLCGFLFGQPLAHLRENSLMVAQLFARPWQAGCFFHLRQNLKQLPAHLFRVVAINRRRALFVEQSALRIGIEKVWLPHV
jgi:hypothetical protein